MAVRWTSTTAEITMDTKALERLVDPHGYNATVVLRVSDDQLPDVLQVLGWPDDRSWVTRGAVKSKKAAKDQPHRGALYFRRGSVNPSGRKSRNGRLPMRQLNKDWATKLYVLGLRVLEGEDAGLELHLAGVRWADIDRVLTEVLHPEPGSWEFASLA